jgi:hypothetical protein
MKESDALESSAGSDRARIAIAIACEHRANYTKERAIGRQGFI